MPVVAQAIMLAVMAANRRWLFVAMLAPGILTCLVSALSNLARMRGRNGASGAEDRAGTESTGSAGADGHGAATRLRTEGTADGTATFPVTASRSLESSLAPSLADRALDWRDVLRQWTCADLARRIVVGLAPDGPMGLDLVRLGPHALVAGTTGSGKSLFLEAWCASYAFALPPDRLNFILLDFKGGSTFRSIGALPHTVGCVSDLDLRHATRALKAIEAELRRRELLAAEHHVAGFDQIPDPPPRLIVVVDEFHALKDQLPGYVDRLVTLASLGRSLGMNLVLCTQNPMGQLSPQLKANVNLNVCLRVRDTLQSKELLGTGDAGDIPANLPGAAWINDGGGAKAMRCSPVADAPAFARACALAARFLDLPAPAPLFSAPLPRSVPAGQEPMIAMLDDGVSTRPLTLDPTRGPVAVVGAPGRGKTTLLDAMERALGALGIPVLRCAPDDLATLPPPPPMPATPPDDSARQAVPRFALLVDDADALLDPMGGHPGRKAFLDALARPGPFVAFCLTSARHLRHPEHCAARVVFPCGDKAADTFAGVPTWLHGEFSPDDCHIPGRAAFVDGARAWAVQCVGPSPARGLTRDWTRDHTRGQPRGLVPRRR